MDANKDYFSNRVTVRNYSGKTVSDELINDILRRAMHAPTCGNMQLYSVIITRDKEMKEKLAKQHFNQPASTGCDIVLTICADFNRFSRWCEISGAKPCYSNFHSFMMAATDAIILAQQITTIAEMEGLGTCYLGTVNYNAKAISDLLELPDLVVPVASLSLGYPSTKATKPERLPADAFIHHEKYRKDGDEEIARLYKGIDENPENIFFVKENNKESLAQVFTDIRYPESTNLEVSKTYSDLLREKKYL